jgi:hypothetical protein
VAANPKVATPNTLHDWISFNYTHASAIGVRRMTDRDKRSISMVRVLLDIRHDAESITREWHRTLDRAGGLMTLMPVLVPGWMRPLAYPWIQDEQE